MIDYLTQEISIIFTHSRIGAIDDLYQKIYAFFIIFHVFYSIKYGMYLANDETQNDLLLLFITVLYNIS